MALRARTFTVDDLVVPADEADELWGITYTGFDTVNVYDGSDNTGKLIFAGGAAPVTFSFEEGVAAEGGLFVDVTGTGAGTLFV